MKRIGMRIMAAALACAAMGACTTDELQVLLGGGPAQGVLAISTDYADTVVSSVDRLSRETAVSELVTSGGSAGLSAPLSGDVVAAHTPSPFGEILLLDRTEGNLTIVTPGTGAIRGQFGVRSMSEDPNPNPTDALVISNEKIYVARQGQFTFAATPFDNERSNDIVIMDPLTGDLTEVPAFDFNVVFGTSGTGHVNTTGNDFARADALSWAGDYVAVTLLNADAAFDGSAGTGLIALLDPATDTIVDATPDTSSGTTDPIVLDAGGGDVCQGPGTKLVYRPTTQVLYVACSGIFGDYFAPQDGDHADQIAASRVMAVDLSPLAEGNDVVVTSVVAAEDFYTGGTMPDEMSPLSGELVILSPTLGFVTSYGSFGCNAVGVMTPCSPDTSAPPQNVSQALFSFNPTTGEANTVPLASAFAYSFGSILGDPFTNTLYLADSAVGAVRIWDVDPSDNGNGSDLSDTAEDESAAFAPTTRPGILPRSLTFY